MIRAFLSKLFDFKPEFWPTVMAVCGFLLLFGLGCWQVQRLFWKETLIARIESRANGPAAALPLEEAGLDEWEYRRVALRGEYDHSREVLVGPRTYLASHGAYVLTPMRLENGRWLMVNRGWVHQKRRDPATREKGQFAGVVEREGLLILPKKDNPWLPENDPAKEQWFWEDIPAIAQAIGIEKPLPYLVQVVGEEPEGGYPKPLGAVIHIRNDHLEYAITWFCLAFGFLTVYFVYHHQKKKSGDSSVG